jgi:hypothetical protein
MKPSPQRKWPLPEEACELVDYLYIEDERTNGAPALSGERLDLARDWLVRVIFQRTDRLAHVEELQRCYGRSRRSSQRGDANGGTIFRHHELFAESKALTLAEKGPADLAGDELARLLLNPFALLDLADLVGALAPAPWLDLLEKQARGNVSEDEARELLQEYQSAAYSRPQVEERELILRKLGGDAVPGSSARRWEIPVPEESGRAWLAEQMYGDAAQKFAMVLYFRPVDGRPDWMEVELEVAPAPSRSDLTLSVLFPTNERRNFTLEVPPELKVDPSAAPRPKTRSEPCDPLPVAACELQEGATWTGCPPELVLRGYPGTMS